MKKWKLAMVLVLMLCVLTGCTFIPFSALGSLYRQNTNVAHSEMEDTEDTVTISRELYERYSQLDELVELLDAVENHYYKEPDMTEVLQGASAGLLKGLGDPYTFYYNPEEWIEMWEEDEGEYAGVGILISSQIDRTNKNDRGVCVISRVFKGSPAEAAGVQRGDILYRVGEDLYVWPETLQDAVDIMRGTPGTPVDVTFLRNGEELTFTMTRAIINVNQVESTMLTDEIGLIAMYEFAGKGDQEFETALNELLANGAKGLIVDLRDNPGGWVDAAQHIGDLFMDAGDLCYLVYRNGSEDHCYPTRDGKTEIPLVLLVNENSASASEILTAALRERAGATVVGVQTFGKGVVQGVLPVGVNGSGFQMTIAEYKTPNGNSVHEVGLTPDVEVPLEEGDNGGYDFADAEHDPQLGKALEIMKDKLK
ncbi:MAG: S41 family peptidase [Clostridiales bacterium]|nr:S41 family peptidase [Clostridiales bacterium]